ncbi:MAG: sugar transferase [Eggerthellaceae bacterium]|nr:sugar transferase [Eggerthellaceae bacterium]
MPWRRRAAPDSRRPARAGIPTELPATSRCRPEFCGDVARAARSSASRATAPRRLSGHAASGVPRGGGGSAPLGRLGGSSHLCAGGTGGGSITPTSKVGPSRRAGRMVLWGCSGPNEEPWLRGGRSWRKAAFAGFRHRSSCSRAPLVENRPIENSAQWDDSAWGRERPSSGLARPFESSSGVFIMRKAIAAICRRNTLSAVPLAIQKPAGQANDPAYRRLQCFFVLTKGMSTVGPRPALPTEVATYDDYQRQRLLVKPGVTCYWQTR